MKRLSSRSIHTYRCLCLLGALTLFMETARGGFITGSGGELIFDENNPWYIGSNPVRYCVVKDQNFSHPSPQTVISAAIETWLNALRSMNMEATSFEFPDGERKGLTTDFRLVSCTEQPELTFFLGSFNERLEEAMNFAARLTVGFAIHEGIDRQTGRARGGIVWLTPDSGERKYKGQTWQDNFWTGDETLYNVLLHELGHVFGFPHDVKVMANHQPTFEVAFPNSTRASLTYLAGHDWWKNGEERCGQSFNREIFRLVFSGDENLEVLCLKRTGEPYTPIQLKALSPDGIIEETRFLRFGLSYRNTRRLPYERGEHNERDPGLSGFYGQFHDRNSGPSHTEEQTSSSSDEALDHHISMGRYLPFGDLATDSWLMGSYQLHSFVKSVKTVKITASINSAAGMRDFVIQLGRHGSVGISFAHEGQMYRTFFDSSRGPTN